MSEMRIATPFVSGLQWVLNEPILESVPVQRADGQRGTGTVQRDPGLTILVTPFIGTADLAVEQHNFPKEAESGPTMQDVLDASGADIATIWATSLSDMADQFPILADPTAEQLDDGPAYYLRLDKWHAQFDPAGPASVLAVLGVYPKDPAVESSQVSGYVELLFIDPVTQERRTNNLNRMSSQVTEWQGVLANEESTSEQKSQAKANIASLQQEIARMEGQYVGSLSDLMQIESVVPSILSLMTGVFSTIKATNARYSDLDVQGFMQRFANRLQTIISPGE